MNKYVVFGAVIVLLLAGNLYLISRYLSLQKEFATVKTIAESRTVSDKVLSFYQLFIEKVLQANGEVSFEDRLQLENAVRDLNDDEILTMWNTFVKSETEKDAQNAVRSLLSILVRKVKL